MSAMLILNMKYFKVISLLLVNMYLMLVLFWLKSFSALAFVVEYQLGHKTPLRFFGHDLRNAQVALKLR